MLSGQGVFRGWERVPNVGPVTREALGPAWLLFKAELSGAHLLTSL